MDEPPSPVPPRIHPRAAFQSRVFGYFQLMRFLALMAVQIQGITVGLHLFLLTKSALYLGYIGLSMFLPQLLFSLPAGQFADRYDRRRIMLICELGMLICTASLIAFSLFGTLRVPDIPPDPALPLPGLGEVYPIFVIMFLVGTCRTFLNPASTSLMPRLIPREHFPNAVMWHSFNFQLSTTIAGLSIGGLFAAIAQFSGRAHPEYIYIFTALLTVGATLILVFKIREVQPVDDSATSTAPREKMTWGTVLAGLRYVFHRPVLLGAISLDMFAVLLGGATALMPIFALEILKVGPGGFGKLEAAQYFGALVMGLVFTHLPPIKRAGWTMLACVAAFGLATIAFGLSRSFVLTLFIVFAIGAIDMVSVVIRQSIIQLRTPDNMRGRVTAVNMIFVGASNQLGEFESGLTAHWWGTVPAVVIGGIGTIVIVVIWAWLFPELRRYGRLDTEHTEPVPGKAVS
jgi:MFS family permease